MGTPAWTERELLEVISKDKKDSENLPLHLIPKAYYDNIPLPQYRYAVEADNKELIEQDLKDNSLIALDYHDMLYRGEDNCLRWIALHDSACTIATKCLARISYKPKVKHRKKCRSPIQFFRRMHK